MKMKWVFAALVLANLGLWMWASWYREEPTEEHRAAQPPIAPEKMRLLTETGVKLQPRKIATPTNAEPVAQAAPGCFRIGPFPDAELAAKAEKILDDWHVRYERRSEQTQTITGYLVYYPALASQKAAEAKRRELTRLGFKDHALIQEEGRLNAISLGQFSVAANAEARVRELAAKGVEAKVQPLSLNRVRYWLNTADSVPAETAAKLKQTDWSAKDIQAREISCPASANWPAPAPAREPPDNAPF